MNCERCGTPNDDGARFCVECGAPLSGAPDAAAGAPPTPGMPPVPMPGPVPMPPQAVPMPGPAASGTAGEPAKGGRNKKTLLIVVIVTLLVLAVAGGVAAFLTYRAELWGGKSLPDVASLAAGTNGTDGTDGGKAGGKTSAKQSKKSAVTAKAVTEALKDKGLKTKTVTEFSGEQSGTFLGYQGLKEGQRVKAGSTVTVRESAGPGVPKGTVGKKATDVVKTFNGMGVPVHYKQVVISQDSKTPEGQVGVTWPTPGTGLSDDDKDDGIYIGVTHKGDGIPVDILGQDKNTALNALQAQGYDVDLEPHFSSKQYVGKISGSYPAPGSTLEKGDSVTLYYGVDASSTKDLLSKTTGSGDYAMKVVNNDATPMIGMYCKATVTDASKDCITLEEADGPYGADSVGGGFMQIKERPADNDYDTLGLNNWSQDVGGVMLSNQGYPGAKDSDLPMANHLLMGKTGAFELYAGMGLPNCGSTVSQFDFGSYCDNGTYRTYDLSSGASPQGNTGLTFRMKDFLVYVPVGTDLKSIEDSGYFDKSALAAANKQKAVDTSRPFIVMRDSSLYDETEVGIKADSAWIDPFVPGNVNGKNPLEPVKPAPSDATVYYLVEQNGDLDWDSLPDAKVAGVKDSSGSSEGKSGSGKMDKVLAEAMKAAAADDYALASGAGAWGASLEIGADGTFKGSYQDIDAGVTGDGYPKGSMAESTYTGRFKSAVKNADGTYTLQCDASALKIDGTVGSSSIKDGMKVTVTKPVGMDPCGKLTLYPKGYDTSKLGDQQRMWAGGGDVASSHSTLPGPALTNDESDSDMEYTFYSGVFGK
ncbi:PASTA domain-containing protein [Bifidobacterium saguinibicoloris]|uniref:PASTA domain-containing protein n=1 Tax=Bifidobacterium saguinibicoloris TaxID=2834433 RepID=UPI001C55B45D|nr:PASTA domain-containing protein [Bifidobacterium saguinibicoloris]